MRYDLRRDAAESLAWFSLFEVRGLRRLILPVHRKICKSRPERAGPACAWTVGAVSTGLTGSVVSTAPATASENRMPSALGRNSHEYPPRARESLRNPPRTARPALRGRNARPERIREFPANFGISADFSAIRTHFREPHDASPCATLCTDVLHVSHCASGLFRHYRDSTSLSAKTVSHWADSSALLGQKVTQESVMWRITSSRRFRFRRDFPEISWPPCPSPARAPTPRGAIETQSFRDLRGAQQLRGPRRRGNEQDERDQAAARPAVRSGS